MRIFIDADAFPNAIKDVLIRASVRLNVPLCFVANKPVRVGGSANISVIQVPAGFDVADDHIAEHTQPGDLVITTDIPLADRVITKRAFALDPRGKLYTQENIKDRLALRGLFKELRDDGMITGGPATFGKIDRQTFANRLDRFLIRRLKIEALEEEKQRLLETLNSPLLYVNRKANEINRANDWLKALEDELESLAAKFSGETG